MENKDIVIRKYRIIKAVVDRAVKISLALVVDMPEKNTVIIKPKSRISDTIGYLRDYIEDMEQKFEEDISKETEENFLAAIREALNEPYIEVDEDTFLYGSSYNYRTEIVYTKIASVNETKEDIIQSKETTTDYYVAPHDNYIPY